MTSISVDPAKNYVELLQDINNYSLLRQERDSNARSVSLLPVSKFHDVDSILKVYGAGAREFGENYVQELLSKLSTQRLPSDIRFHIIGHVQTNKIRKLLIDSGDRLSCIHTVDSVESMSAISRASSYALSQGIRTYPLKVFIQVNISNQETKSGADPNPNVVANIIESASDSVVCVGLMTIPDPDDHEAFIHMEQLLKDVREELLSRGMVRQSELFCEMSAGMSDDWRDAVDHGSTLVRIGTAIFGPRPPH